MSFLPEINQEVNVNDLTRLNDSIRKNSQVGYQTPAVMDGSFSPLVPQSIEATLASATHTMRDLALFPMLPKVQVSNTVHEYAVIKEHGLDMDPFISEGGGSSADFGSTASSYERKSVKIKYMAERRQISDVSTLVGMIGPNPNALAEETERGTMSLLRKVEVESFYGDEDVKAKGFDGLIKQIERTDGARDFAAHGGRPFSRNQEDLAGASLSAIKLHDILGELHSAPRFGKPDAIFVDPKQYSKLIADSAANGRHDSMLLVNQGDQGVVTLGAGPRIHVMGPMGPVPVVAAPFLNRQLPAPTAAAGNSATRPSNPTFAANATQTGAASQFDAAGTGAGHDGEVRYVIVAVNAHGYSAPVVTGAVSVDDGNGATFQLNTGAIAAEYYRIYRTPCLAAGQAAALSDAEVVAQAKLIAEVLPSELVGSALIDNGIERLDCGRVMIASMDQGTMEFARLLDFLRRPLAETGAAKQFLLMLFGSPVVKVPGKNFILRNVAR
jgi:hypothetical protein